jgi:hypothetical protein
VTLPTDDEMMAALAQTREYTVVLLKAGPAYDTDGAPAIVREHGRRNFALRADGSLNVVCPVLDDSDLRGVGIFARSLDQTREIMDGDPGVLAGVFVYEMHPVRSFPGDALAQYT